jgi:hypothetical protein
VPCLAPPVLLDENDGFGAIVTRHAAAHFHQAHRIFAPTPSSFDQCGQNAPSAHQQLPLCNGEISQSFAAG